MLTACNLKFIKQKPVLIVCDKAEVPKAGTVTTKNAPELIIRLYGHIETNHKCMDTHREKGEIR